MAKLWSGRFTEETDEIVEIFNASIEYDKRLYEYDILGSKAHVMMLEKQNIISDDEKNKIINGLNDLKTNIDLGKVDFTIEYEDIHMNLEKLLTDNIGDAGKKMHTGRSRNDQVALDMKLYSKEIIHVLASRLLVLIETFNKVASDNLDVIMPGFTHLQKAQPVTFAHHILAYSEMFKRDYNRLISIKDRMNTMPLGSGALAGTTFPLDREYVASLLNFDSVTLNSLDGVSDRDYLIEILSAFSTIMMHISRFSEELILWSTNEFSYIELSDSFSTGSSIMPQKKNPDIPELLRGKTGRVYGSLMAILTVMKGIPLAYNKDMQEDKEMYFDSIDTVIQSVTIFAKMIEKMKINPENMLTSAKLGYANATEIADYLAAKGLPFRDAHEITGKLVLHGIDNGLTLEDIDLSVYQAHSNLFDDDIYHVLDLNAVVSRRDIVGGPARSQNEEVIKINQSFLDKEINYLTDSFIPPSKLNF